MAGNTRLGTEIETPTLTKDYITLLHSHYVQLHCSVSALLLVTSWLRR